MFKHDFFPHLKSLIFRRERDGQLVRINTRLVEYHVNVIVIDDFILTNISTRNERVDEISAWLPFNTQLKTNPKYDNMAKV